MRQGLLTWFTIQALLVFIMLTVTACVADEQPSGKGDTPPSVSPSSITQTVGPQTFPPKTDLSLVHRQAWRDILHWPTSCEEAFDYPDPNWGGLTFYPLTTSTYLVEVVCTRGAYQGFQVYLYFDEEKTPAAAQLLTFKTYEAEDEHSLVEKQTEELWGTAQFNSQAQELTVLNRYRGLGDCGSLVTYRFPGGKPELVSFRVKLACDGKGADNPAQWEKKAL